MLLKIGMPLGVHVGAVTSQVVAKCGSLRKIVWLGNTHDLVFGFIGFTV